MRVLSICGSLQQKSGNLTLLQVAARVAPAGVVVRLYDGLRELPHFNPDLEQQESLPVVEALRAAISGTDALLIASPEYGHSLPGALKNAIDWVIGTGELNEKVIGVTASTNAPGRGQRGLDALAHTLKAVNATLVGGVPIVRGPDDSRTLASFVAEVMNRAS